MAAPGAADAQLDTTDDRRLKLYDYIKGILESGRMPRGNAYSLAGKLGFAQTHVFERVGRSFPPPIYAHERSKSDVLGKWLRADLQ